MLDMKNRVTGAVCAVVGCFIGSASAAEMTFTEGGVKFTAFEGDEIICTDAAQYGYQWSELAASVGHIVITQYHIPHPELGEGQTTTMSETPAGEAGLVFFLPLPEGLEVCLAATFEPAGEAS